MENKDLDLSFLDKNYATYMLEDYIPRSVWLLSRKVIYTCNVVAFDHFMSLVKQDQTGSGEHFSELRQMLELADEVYHDDFAEPYDLAYIHTQQIIENKKLIVSKL